ncbi:MAG TPA: amidophosphoribosyltransferase [Ruminococcaceae bacterium]|nr:amidophosphoribosyltransferase [Oscillospiraceae bacterium]
MTLMQKIACIFFPQRCVGCGKVIYPDELLCSDCSSQVSRVEEPICPRCGHGSDSCICQNKRFSFSQCRVPFYYEGAIKRGLLRFKFYGHPASAQSFAALTLPTVSILTDSHAGEPIDFITAVPLSVKRMRVRGYNQSALIGKELAHLLNLPYKNVLCKPADIPAQHSLKREDRWKNIEGAFCVRNNVRGKRILLIDDILTTGATLQECASVLRLAGAKEIRCTAIACVR